MTTDGDQERRIWELLTRDFYWQVPPHHPVRVYDGSVEISTSVRLQIFEMAVATLFAHMRPEFAWRVSPSGPDRGLDFLGIHRFLEDRELGIEAAITVGGQCKKRTTVNEIVGDIAGSLIRMGDAFNPTLFVVAFSARLAPHRVEQARGMLERQTQRHCHILDRTQIEGLLGDYLSQVTEILQEGLSASEVDEVLRYFEARGAAVPSPDVTANAPSPVLAGVPFHIEVNVRWTLASHPAARLWWRPSPGEFDAGAVDAGAVTVIGPIGAEGSTGVPLAAQASGDDPWRAPFTLELLTYSVGRVDLGEISVGLARPGAETAERVPLGSVDVAETMRPRFFDRPFRGGLQRLSDAYEQTRTGIVNTVAVVGAGGSGKSRMCEEFAMEKRRRGCGVATAKQAKTHEAPHRLLADLLVALAADAPSIGDPVDEVLVKVEQYDASLAARAAPAIRSLFGAHDPASGDSTEQTVVSALVLLAVARSRRAPLIVHLQDLHWCSADVLLLLERLVWQLSQVAPPRGAGDQTMWHGVLFLFEGRVHESGASGAEAWTSAPFEAFLERLDCTTVRCSAFSQEDGLAFARLLFEHRHNAHRLVANDLLGVQQELIDRVHKTAGGNPFHTLEQVRLLKEIGVLGQNPKTGLLYMIRPEPATLILPDSVFTAISLRWHYLRDRAPSLALLIWAAALLEDQLPAPLFHRLWRELAPEISLREVDGTDMLWTGDGRSHEVLFRHENYFESLRRFTVPDLDRRRVVDAYCSWFAEIRRPSAASRFRWARVLLESPDADVAHMRAMLVSALRSARKRGDVRLARRISAYRLDLAWSTDERSSVVPRVFLRDCDEEIDLCRELLGIDRDQAALRLDRLRERIAPRFGVVESTGTASTRGELERRHLAADMMQAQVLFNDRRAVQSAEIAGRVADEIRSHRTGYSDESWESLEMEVLYTQSCADAHSGEYGRAVQSSAAASAIAWHSSSHLARKVVSTYGTMLLSEDPLAGEALLRRCLATWPDDDTSDAYLVHVHLSMALVLQAFRCPDEPARRLELLNEAGDRTTRVFDACRRLGLYPDAGAAALVRGVVSALACEGNEAAWFAQGVAAAARGRQMETLWRSHINLATALYRKEGHVTPSAHDHTVAALEIMQDTLAVYSQADRSPRFELLRVGLASAAAMLLASGDNAGRTVLERYPRLRTHFSDPDAGVLAAYDGGERHYQWLRIGDVDFILY